MRYIKVFAIIFALSLLIALSGCNNEKEVPPNGNLKDVSLNPGDVYAIVTFLDYGEVTFKLFPDIAPVAVEKFTSLAERGYYEHKTIHRVVKDALIQGGSLNGDGTDGSIDPLAHFDVESSGYAKNFYGALCFAPNKEGKNLFQLYIINNKQPVDIDADILAIEEQLGDKTKVFSDEAIRKYNEHLEYLKSIPDEVKDRYFDKGGYYQLDGKNTVFGQIVTGYEVIDDISNTEVVSGNVLDDERGVFSKPYEMIMIESVEIVRIPLPEPTTITEETKATRPKPKRTTPSTTKLEDAYTDIIIVGETGAPVPNDLPEDSSTISETHAESSETTVFSEPDVNMESQSAASEGEITDPEILVSSLAETVSEFTSSGQATFSNNGSSGETTIDIDSGLPVPNPIISE
ncbi:MAG: peptidylprolyl isomerase [Eubacterium sp.]|jgi:cyclophilin family peptidyl-prolyl cis-trans isomerase|nr:peptidylprolyl isomerase [Eubacterium sp.]